MAGPSKVCCFAALVLYKIKSIVRVLLNIFVSICFQGHEVLYCYISQFTGIWDVPALVLECQRDEQVKLGHVHD
jgi:hypothetical protein